MADRPGSSSRRRSGWRRRQRIALTLGVVVALGGAVFLGRRLLRDRSRDDVLAVATLLKAGQVREAAPLLEKIAAREPGNVRAASDLARCLALLSRLDDAETHARRAVEIDPNFAPPHAVLAEVAAARGDVAARLDHARRAVSGREPPTGAREALVVALLEAGRADEATGMLLALPDERRRGPAATELVLRALQASGADAQRQARLLGMLRASMESGGAAQASPRASPADVVLRARVALAVGDAESAVATLRGAESSRELNRTERAWLAHALARVGQRDTAIVMLDRLERAIADDPAHPPTDAETAALCAAQIAAGRFDAARDTLARMPAPARDGVGARRLRLSISLAAAAAADATDADWEAIADDASALLELRSTDEAALAARAQARIATGRIDDALADVAAIRDLTAGSARADWLNGLALAASGMPAAALPLLERGRATASADEATATILRTAVTARRADVARQEALALRAPLSDALIAAVEALGENWASVERAVRAESFAACTLPDRLFAARTIAAGGRGDLARIAVEGIDPSTCPPASATALADVLAMAGSLEASAAAAARAEAAGGRAAAEAAAWRAQREVLLAAADPAAASAAIERLRATPEGRVPALLMEAEAAIGRGDLDAARRAAKAAVEARPHDPRALGLLLRSEWDSGAYQNEAFATADRLLAIAPEHGLARAVRAQRLLGEASLAYGDRRAEEALGMAREAAELSPTGSPLFAAALLAARLGDLDRAYEDAEALRNLPDGLVRGAVLQGMIRYGQGRHSDAVARLREAAQASPDDLQIRSGIVVCLLAAGDAKQAVAEAEALHRAAPASADAQRLLASALTAAGRHDEAILRAQAVVAADPGAFAAHDALARAVTAAGRPEDAVRALEAAVGACPDDRRAWEGLADALVAGGRAAEALALADRMAMRPALRTPAALLRARLHGRAGDAASELRSLREAVEGAPEDVEARMALATRLVRDRAAAEARTHLAEVVRLAPRTVRAHLLLGTLAERDERWDEALAHYEEALRVAPSDAAAANNVAWQLVRASRDLPRAVTLARRAVARSPGVGEFHDTAALALAAAGERESAAVEADRAATLLPDDLDVLANAAEILATAGRAERATELALKVDDRAVTAGRKDLSDRARRVLARTRGG